MEGNLQNTNGSLTSANTDLRNDAINKLHDFIDACEAHRGKAFTNEQADALITNASHIITRLQRQ